MLPFPFINSMGLPSSKLGFVAKPEMPPHLNVLFRARPPLEYSKPYEKGKYRQYDPVVSDAGNSLSLFENGPPPERTREETFFEKRQRELRENLREHHKKNKKNYVKWNPTENPDATMDPYRTLFVARLDNKTDEKKLKRVFGEFGPVKRIKLVRDSKTGESRHYGFVEFENLADFKEAYKRADGMKVDGKKILVDYERGRTVPGWKPRRLGGGKGITRRSREVEKILEEINKEEEEEENVREEVEEVKLKGTDEFKVPKVEEEGKKKRERSRSKEKVKDKKEKHEKKDKHRREERTNSHKHGRGSKRHDSRKDRSRHSDEYEPGEIISAKTR